MLVPCQRQLFVRVRNVGRGGHSDAQLAGMTSDFIGGTAPASLPSTRLGAWPRFEGI